MTREAIGPRQAGGVQERMNDHRIASGLGARDVEGHVARKLFGAGRSGIDGNRARGETHLCVLAERAEVGGAEKAQPALVDGIELAGLLKRESSKAGILG